MHNDGTWAAFEQDWREQCNALDEDIDNYASPTFAVISPLAQGNEPKAGLFALRMNGRHVAVCQINTAAIPKYDAPVLRVRYMTLSPEFDLTEKTPSEYGDMLVSLLFQVLKIAAFDTNLGSNHIKFHLRSPTDQSFFSAIGRGLDEARVFDTVQTRGAWLYITRK